jgi:Fe-S-cluster containining protein
MITKKTKLKDVLKAGKECNKCGNCCSHGTGFLVDGESKNISKFLDIKEEELDKLLDEVELFNKKMLRPKTIGKPFGKCVFLKDKLCSIQEVKPLHCRIGNCNSDGEEISAWFTLNYLVDPKDPESVRQYKIYLETGGKLIKGGEIEELVPDKQKLSRILNFEIIK